MRMIVAPVAGNHVVSFFAEPDVHVIDLSALKGTPLVLLDRNYVMRPGIYDLVVEGWYLVGTRLYRRVHPYAVCTVLRYWPPGERP